MCSVCSVCSFIRVSVARRRCSFQRNNSPALGILRLGQDSISSRVSKLREWDKFCGCSFYMASFNFQRRSYNRSVVAYNIIDFCIWRAGIGQNHDGFGKSILKESKVCQNLVSYVTNN